MQKLGGKNNHFFRQISTYVSIIQPFRILIGRFRNLSKKLLVKPNPFSQCSLLNSTFKCVID